MQSDPQSKDDTKRDETLSPRSEKASRRLKIKSSTQNIEWELGRCNGGPVGL